MNSDLQIDPGMASAEGESNPPVPKPEGETNPPAFPEPPTGNKNVKVTEEELQYRKERFKNKNIIRDFRDYLRCTTCYKSMYKLIINGGKVTHHPVFKVLHCEECKAYYECGEFSMDEDGTDKYCRWCGGGCTLLCCTKCLYGFCNKCIRKHFGQKVVKDVEKDENWLCYVCNPRPMWELRGICFYAKLHAKKVRSKSGQDKKKGKKSRMGFAVADVSVNIPEGKSKVKEASPVSAVNGNDSENGGKSEPESRPSSRASSETTIIFENPDVASNNNNNNNGDDITTTPKTNGLPPTSKPKKLETESEEEVTQIKKKKKRKANVLRDSPERETEYSSGKVTDFPISSKIAKKDLHDIYLLTQMTSNLCFKITEKRLTKVKYVNTYQDFCKEYAKVNQIADCLQDHFVQLKAAANEIRDKLKEYADEVI